MRTIVCTGIWGSAWERYGRDFAESFARFWPEDVELVAYTDRTDFTLPRGELRQLSTIGGHDEFLTRFRADPVANGRQKAPHADWKPGDVRSGYSWSHDAVKWFRQGLIPEAVARTLQIPAILCWLDADVITTAPVPENWIDGLIGEAHGAYLGRDVHSEIGFWAVRLPRCDFMVAAFSWLYRSGAFLGQKQSHSAYIWDVAREFADVNMRNLTPGASGHVFPLSPLAACLEHRKGHLKPA